MKRESPTRQARRQLSRLQTRGEQTDRECLDNIGWYLKTVADKAKAVAGAQSALAALLDGLEDEIHAARGEVFFQVEVQARR
jgi:hypothetical protein